jgi:CspA family cold shock protein
MRSVLILKSLTLGTVTSHPQSRVFSHLLKEKIMAIGTVKWFNNEKGYGFIAPSDGAADVFAHYSAITSNGYRTLEENQQVEFDVTQGPKGPQAENIRQLLSTRLHRVDFLVGLLRQPHFFVTYNHLKRELSSFGLKAPRIRISPPPA